MAKQPVTTVESVEETNTAPVPAKKLVLQVENLEEAINALEAFAVESVMASQILSKVEEVRNLSRVK
jgi:folylpolyglutamate synthase/dihydropteroate synthase